MADDLENLMLVYSRRGVRDWRMHAAADLRKKAGECLLNAVAEDEGEVEWAIGSRRTVSRFIPMPRSGYKGKGFEWCFFLPVKASGKLASLALFILVNRARKDSVAFRFEGSGRGRHAYSHIQLTSKLPIGVAGENVVLREWLPVSYPAFPVRARNRTEMFLAMMTAVHGYSGGVDVLIEEIFQGTGRPNYARKYREVLENMLVKLE